MNIMFLSPTGFIVALVMFSLFLFLAACRRTPADHPGECLVQDWKESSDLIRNNFPLLAAQSSPGPASDFAQVCSNTSRSILLGPGAPGHPKPESYSGSDP